MRGNYSEFPRQCVPLTWMVLALGVSFTSNHWLRIRHAATKLFDVGPTVFVDRPFQPAAKGPQSKYRQLAQYGFLPPSSLSREVHLDEIILIF
jgi:hypothetical protein